MPFNVQRVEKLTGLRVERDPARPHRWLAFAETGEPYAAAEHPFSDHQARRQLAQTVLRLRCAEVIEEQGGACARCGQSKPLQVHHKIYRSHQGTHERGNLEALCVSCHEKEHRPDPSASDDIDGLIAKGETHG